mgnify:CR=1 FL=1
MNDNFFYDIDEILRALDHYQGDPFFSQQYAALLQEQISKGLDLLLKKDHVVPLFDPALYKKAIPGAYLPPGPSRSSLDLDE